MSAKAEVGNQAEAKQELPRQNRERPLAFNSHGNGVAVEVVRRHHAWLREAGSSFRDAVHAYSVLDSYTYGFALQEKTIPFGTPEESAEMAASTVGDMGAAYPYLAEVVGEFSRSGYDYTEEFEFGLDLILDGLERFLPGSRPRSQRS
jgi:hypothetical protein